MDDFERPRGARSCLASTHARSLAMHSGRKLMPFKIIGMRPQWDFGRYKQSAAITFCSAYGRPSQRRSVNMPSLGALAGQKALVTGANSGIGRGVAVAMGNAGADVIVNYIDGDAAADDVVQEIRRSGAKASAFKADVSSEVRSLCDVRICGQGAGHHRYSGRQCRAATRFCLPGNDAREMEQGSGRQFDRAVSVRPSGDTRISSPGRRAGRVEGGRENYLYELGASDHSVGWPRQLRNLQGRHQNA